MDVLINEKGSSKVAVINSSDILVNNPKDALDLMMTIISVYKCDRMVINKSAFAESFFDLKTGLAGEILQKYTNYQMKIAIIGDFEIYSSKSLKDFIFESNKGSQVLFLPDEKTAIDKLHRAV